MYSVTEEEEEVETNLQGPVNDFEGHARDSHFDLSDLLPGEFPPDPIDVVRGLEDEETGLIYNVSLMLKIIMVL